MTGKIIAPRSLILICLISILLANIYFSMRSSEVVAPTNMGLSNTMDFSSEYVESLRKEIVSGKKSELIDEIKLKLREELRPDVESKVKEEVNANFRPEYEKKVEQELKDSFTEKYMLSYKLNYGLMEDLAADYLKENEKKVEKLSLLELASSISGDAKNGSATVETHLTDLVSRKLWYQHVLQNVIMDSAPLGGPLSKEEKGEEITDCASVTDSVIYDQQHLSRVQLSDERMEDFKTSHSKVLQRINMMETPSKHIFHGRGIVVSGGGDSTAGALVTIIQIREMGSKLPIELILNEESEYDTEICETLANKFDFQCAIIQNEIGADVYKDLSHSRYSLKVLGLLVSSFDHTISIDADNMPIKNPDDLLTAPAYLESEFILWPDIYQRTILPQYYEIAGKQPGETVRRAGIPNSNKFTEYFDKGSKSVHFHDLGGLPDSISTENGQMVFSKTKHYRSLILSCYYNVYGESHYWPLFYQGSPRPGDRETFVPALHVFNEPYHVVRKNSWLAGFEKEENTFQETTIVQYDPSTSYEWESAWKRWLRFSNRDTRSLFYQNNDDTRAWVEEFKKLESIPSSPQVYFLHIYGPKLNFVTGTSENHIDWDRQRNLGKFGRYKDDFGDTDWELRFYSISQWLACKGIQSNTWWNSVSRSQKDVCEKVSSYVNVLLADTEDSNAQSFEHININDN